ncbi:MAG: lipid II:glycine glycyltransferase FemX [Candidatus Dormibacteria bacterium]
MRRAGPLRYLYLPFGPSLRGPEHLAAAMEAARRRAKRHGCAFVRFEPGDVSAEVIAATGARRVHTRQYEHTVVLSLTPDVETLRKGMNSGHRSRVNGAAKRGLRVESSNDPARMAAFVALLRTTEQRAEFFSFEDRYYDAIAAELLPAGDATLYFTMHERDAVAAGLMFDFGPTRYYAFGATDTAARKLMPAPPLVWQSIVDAKESGRSVFDFWGAAPPGAGPGHPWSGITNFKMGFGAERRSYAGTWELPVRPVLARAFTLARRVRGRSV